MKKTILILFLFLSLLLFSFTSLAQIPGDFNEDGKVDFDDLMIFALAYGSTPSSSNWDARCDLHPDNHINFEDLMIFAMNYGKTEQEITSWTVLVYICGDSDLDYYAWDDLREMESIGSTDEVNIIVQLDPSAYRSCSGTYRYHITGVERGISYPLYPEDIVQILPEKNMADPAVLTDFISWSMNNYPAEKYLLVLWNHGTGWRREYIPTKGIIYDDSSGDYMTIAELAQALENIPQSIDILGFDACLMQMTEVAYEISKISNAPKYMVASQADEWGYGWPYDDIAAHLISNPSMGELTLAKTIVDDYTNNCGKTGTLSVLDFSSFDSNTIEAINSFSNALMDSDYQSEINDARTLSQSYSLFYNSKDFFDFSQRIYDTVPDCQSEAQEVMNQLNNLIPYEANTGGAVASSHGLSIYLPGSPDNYDNNYDFLQFATDTKWDEFLKYRARISEIYARAITYQDFDEDSFQEKMESLNMGRKSQGIFWFNDPSNVEKGIIQRFIDVSWCNYPEATGYKLYRSVNGGEWQLYDEFSWNPGTTGLTDQNVSEGNIYSYYVTAYGPGWETKPSQQVTIDTWLPPCSLLSPADGENIIDSAPEFVWNPVELNLPHGPIEYCLNGLCVDDITAWERVWYEWFDDNISSTKYSGEPLVPGHVYCWNAWGDGYDENGCLIASSWSEYRRFNYVGY